MNLTSSESFDLIVIGSGPAGYTAALHAVKKGFKTALVEKSIHLGGTCLNVGCIPTKALLEAAKLNSKLKTVDFYGFTPQAIEFNWHKIMDYKDSIVDLQRKGLDFLFKKSKIKIFNGFATLAGPDKVEVNGKDGLKTLLEAKFILLATGSKVKEFPPLLTTGRSIINSDHIVFADSLPKTMCIVGGGVIGMEFASLFAKFGTEITVIEVLDRILPFEDLEVVTELLRHLKKQKITIRTKTEVVALEEKGNHALVTTKDGPSEEFEKVLIAVGRSPVTSDLGLDKVGLEVSRGFVKVDEHYRTNLPNIFAVGDIISTPALAHTAYKEAIHAVEVMAGNLPVPLDYSNNPNAVYSFPEIASVGATEEKLKSDNIPYKKIKFSFLPMARARIENANEGFVKILYEPSTFKIIGAHIIGAKATELISNFALAKTWGLTLKNFADTIIPHPTVSEALMEAAQEAVYEHE